MSLRRAEVAEAAFGVCLGCAYSTSAGPERLKGCCSLWSCSKTNCHSWGLGADITDIRCHLKGLGILLEMSCVVAVSAKVTGSWLGGGLSIIDS